ncbi:serine protease [Bacillus clarus]|uniref:Serine protease n=1 Tax=Bacillus clarus TaxID=2338372 RepID=A0A090YZV3_9BACI|nr:S8 family peptidase [Bacillus clarus]KFN03917.1 subtilase family protein [Bacillus clarus]RFT66362.1 serine protease [Bacillus clarus]
MKNELIIISSSQTNLDMNKKEGAFISSSDYMFENVLANEEINIQPLFDINSIANKNLLTLEVNKETQELSKFYKAFVPDEQIEDLVVKLLNNSEIEGAYIKPSAELSRLATNTLVNDSTNSVISFINNQGYLGNAPEGINVHSAWNLPGGKGAGVNIIDIEGAWRFSHEDLKDNQGGVIDNSSVADLHLRNHGTSVLGVMSGDDNSFGITGICPEAKIRAISVFDKNGNISEKSTSNAIVQAANLLKSGDIILIEIHRPGPRFHFQSPKGQSGYIPIEWWPDDLAAIQYATSRGIVVVEAGGNGSENLDDPLYNKPAVGFPSTWTNPFNRKSSDSGAIVVGAGAPPPGTHGRNHGPDRSRLFFSNYGSMFDAQGWGDEVTTTGGINQSQGDLQGGSNEDTWYTDKFNGTSSAAPIIAGTIACLQGILLARNKAPLTPRNMRNLLRNTGSLQQDASMSPKTQRIGNRPNLEQLIRALK